MIDAIIKGIGIAAAGAAAWYADKYVKEKTGKHIHEHAVDYVKSLWQRLRNWARDYLDKHENVKKLYVSAVNIAAAATRARNAGLKFVRIKILGQQVNDPRPIVTHDEEVELSQIDGILQQAKTAPVLAMRG